MTTHNDEMIDINGTYLQGYLTSTYADLVQAFGQPEEGDEYKIDAEWSLKFDDGSIATIYNWKDGINYCGAEGTPTDEITEWHVGGVSDEVVGLVKSALAIEATR